jgi:hypothetical protein
VRLKNLALAPRLLNSGAGGTPPLPGQSVLGEIFNIGGTEEVSMLELAKLVVKTLGSKSRIELIPYDQAYAPGFDDMRRRRPLVEKLERFVKFRPRTTLREIITLTAEGRPRRWRWTARVEHSGAQPRSCWARGRAELQPGRLRSPKKSWDVSWTSNHRRRCVKSQG